MSYLGLSRLLLKKCNVCTNMVVRTVTAQTLNHHGLFHFITTDTQIQMNCLMKPIKRNNLFSTTTRFYSDNKTSDAGSKEHLEKLVNNNTVVVFMKGVPEQPMCGFSNAVVQILRMHGVEYDSHNVLDDETLRSGVKKFSEWPTIPQVYFKGEFIGGCDILLQMHQSGDLIDELKTVGIRSALLDKDKE